jgi:predicted dehydrogenase
MTLRAFRVGVVGARRTRQGVGEHLARFLHVAGARVVAVAGTTSATAAEAARVAAASGIVAAPFADVAGLVAAAALDALVIASPVPSHEAYLRLALDARLHVLCEKPLLVPDAESVERGVELLEAFAARNLLLAVNTPWRHVLGAYMQLEPDVAPRTARRFEMELSPAGEGAAMIPDALPHPLAVLAHLHPSDAPLEDVTVELASARAATVRFRTGGGAGGGVDATIRLATCERPPRPAAIGFDGRLVRREIEEPGYRLFLRATDGSHRRVALPDPMEALVRRFVERVRKGGPFPVDPVARAGLGWLVQCVDAAARVAPGSGRG